MQRHLSISVNGKKNKMKFRAQQSISVNVYAKCENVEIIFA